MTIDKLYYSTRRDFEEDCSTTVNEIIDKVEDVAANVQTLADAVAYAESGMPVNGIVTTLEYNSGTGIGGNTYQKLDAGSSGARPVEDGGSVIHLTGGSGGLYLKGLFLNGVWIEQFGAKKDGTDCKPADDAASLYVKSLGGGKINLGEGDYSYSKLIIRDKVKRAGSLRQATALFPLASVETGDFGFIEIESAPVQFADQSDYTIYGSATKVKGDAQLNPLQWMIYVQAKFDFPLSTSGHGGLWNTDFINVSVRNHNKGVWFRGGYTTAHSKLPNQFITLKNCNIIGNGGAGSERVRMTGQNGQINFTSGSAENHEPALLGINFNATFDPSPVVQSTVNGESALDTAGVAPAIRSPSNVNLTAGFTLQNSTKQIYMYGVAPILIHGCWLENSQEAIEATNGAIVTVTATNFANAGNNSGNGYIYKDGINAMIVDGGGNDYAGIYDKLRVYKNDAISFPSNTSPSNNTTYGLFQDTSATRKQVAINASGEIDIKGHSFALVSQYVTDKAVGLSVLKSNLMAGQRVVLKAISSAITLSNAGNIDTGLKSSVTIQRDTFVELVRIHGSSTKEFALLTAPPHQENSIPSNGYYYSIGTVVNKINAASGQPSGWYCTTAGLAGTTAVFASFPNIV